MVAEADADFVVVSRETSPPPVASASPTISPSEPARSAASQNASAPATASISPHVQPGSSAPPPLPAELPPAPHKPPPPPPEPLELPAPSHKPPPPTAPSPASNSKAKQNQRAAFAIKGVAAIAAAAGRQVEAAAVRSLRPVAHFTYSPHPPWTPLYSCACCFPYSHAVSLIVLAHTHSLIRSFAVSIYTG